MILGLGSDIVDIERIAAAVTRHPERFARRILTEHEWHAYQERDYCVNFLAKRFAAKEAVSKCFGTGLRGALQWQTIQVLNSDLGQPTVELLDDAHALLAPNAMISITLSDERRYAIAFAVYHLSAPC
ncbi:Holo-[acyl-carrier protein] synthase [Aequoribacter fuscus]|jgi:holo-[acyl-carrier protein] synthase|uniref:Holo-[acyl-carrier-protein] synthase n=1 Tax=Aequoribacter fuscus TaxID=2518989 RepID=F3KZK0_9GAMM|nr:holo-ACP synthase [Aequoribacter fuscus]EGG30429.1 Holo-[acyl-carrier protein] synthase [Aequoribacter fuscus]